RELRLMLEKQMVVAFQSDETSIWNTVCQLQSSPVRDASVVPAVKDESRHTDFRKTVTNIDIAQCFLEADRVLRRDGDTRQLVHPSNLLQRAFRYESRSKHLAERRIVLAPTVENQCLHRLTASDLREIRADSPTGRVPSVQDQAGNAARVPDRIFDGDCATL